MTTQSSAQSDGIDPSVPTAAGMYDYYLGGRNNFAADRRAANKVIAAAPEVILMARENRGFIQRTVRFLARDAGIRQFLDIGSGLPTQGSVHEIAQAEAPDARVVYVDNDPQVLARSRALAPTEGKTTSVITADLRDPDAILNHPETRAQIDFDQPMAILLVAVLHFIDDEADPYGIVARLRDAMAPGSYLVINHATADPRPDNAGGAAEVYKNTKYPATHRTRDQIERFFDGAPLIDPGLVFVPEWRPDIETDIAPEEVWILGGVGRKPTVDQPRPLSL
ncbi:SAM-dependent methyltransferase [Micromonospora sp. DR5-3]|uniref:SAM-dependent methyltransferase n=1 Tax=unclassified Micromonospora TaxID=2617518 RepID=UPI0011D4BD09|nr:MULTISPECIES: SAM-dependent methyltransferase [unclassified Micromonospora]MCW3817608.1 SAM-dependent methyltransferase [Micromonospora sp. DR5-3]TYC22036.1 SAM-dependent methyltransferase [Micromonospora sp. MP36]